MAGDRITIDGYDPHRVGAPLHLINLTINETFDTRSSLLEPDRRGVPMALGPTSLDVGVYHHARRVRVDPSSADEATSMQLQTRAWAGEGPHRVFPPHKTLACERLDLGEWIALSGAAVAPGLGVRTRVARSFLLTALNLRLGGWWDSGVAPRARGARGKPGEKARHAFVAAARFLVPTYVSLYDEAFARFPGTARQRWYLSDGGHFENTGCYELVRRRLPLIVACDASADPAYLFEDAGNLVRLARVDFGAEIEFMDDATLSSFLAPSVRPFFGTLEQIRLAATSADAGARRPLYGALAHVRYARRDPAWPNAPTSGLLMLIKPVVGATEPEDIQSYRRGHASFPQESTADQFFDDPQWEAYRRLGEEAGRSLFKARAGELRWAPHDMRYNTPI
jgi:hypothetical protein